ncbi:MAG: hypothetical protein KAJ19_17335 [Gammaproteobacteria bacterium]|nr:hypothetical protein [Gammaproteobacteria bacterium]
MDSKVKLMTIRAKPNIPDWRLTTNTRKLVIYTSSKLNMTITLTKLKGTWYVERINEDSGLMSNIGEAPLKGGAISQAKIFMAQHPAPADGVPFDPAEYKLEAGRFKSPGRVTQFSRKR